MKICVAVKRVVDYNVKVRIKPDGSGVETDQVKMSMNPFCEIAVEEAIRLREKHGGEVTLVTIGTETSQDILRHGLALGADSAILVSVAPTQLAHLNNGLFIAKILRDVIQSKNFDLVLLGKQAIDSDNNQTGQMLAGLLNWPQATFASVIEAHIAEQTSTVSVTREVDGGLEKLMLTLPAVVTTDLRLNTPRYATLPNIMKAKKKPLELLDFKTLPTGAALSDTPPAIKIIKVEQPKQKSAGIKVNTVEELVEKLRHEAKVIG